MVDLETLIQSQDEDELREMKLWLFQENIRIQNERAVLESERAEMLRTRDKFLEERTRFRSEMDSLNRRAVLEQKRLREENLFFEKKMDILRAGFSQLDLDRREFEQEKQRFYRAQAEGDRERRQDVPPGLGGAVEILFRTVNNPLALRKRYKDLVKIFHPDNLFGDAELVQLINHEYQRRRKEE